MTVEFGREVRIYYDRLHKAHGLNQKDVGKQTGISQSEFSKIMKGYREANPAVAEDLINVLNVPPENQAKFLLLAAGHPLSLVDSSLKAFATYDPTEHKMYLIRKLQNFLEAESV